MNFYFVLRNRLSVIKVFFLIILVSFSWLNVASGKNLFFYAAVDSSKVSAEKKNCIERSNKIAVRDSVIEEKIATVSTGLIGPTMRLSDSLSISVRKPVFNFILEIKNPDDSLLDGYLYIYTDRKIDVTPSRPNRIRLKKGEHIFIQGSVYGSPLLSAGSYPIHFDLFRKEQSGLFLIKEMKSVVTVMPYQSIRIIPDVSYLVIKKTADTLDVPVRVVNESNSAQHITLVEAFPRSVSDGLCLSTFFSLSAFSDTVVHFKSIATRRMMKLGTQDLMISGLYFNGDVFGNFIFKVYMAESRRRYSVPDNTNWQPASGMNAITLQMSNLGEGSNNAVYSLNGKGKLALGQGILSYGFDGKYWNAYDKTPLISNTYLGYEIKNLGVTLGNLTYNDEIYLQGKGIKIDYHDVRLHNTYEAGFIEKSSDLVDVYGNFSNYGHATWFLFNHKTDKMNTGFSWVYDLNRLGDYRNILYNGFFSMTLSRHFKVSAKSAMGYTSNMIPGSDDKVSLMESLDYNWRFWKLAFEGQSYYSSPYYPGSRRGYTSFLQKISLNGQRFNFWISGNYYNYDPRYISATTDSLTLSDSVYSALYRDGSYAGSLGFSFRFPSGVTFSLFPTYSKSFNDAGVQHLFIQSLQFNGTFNYSSPQPFSSWSPKLSLVFEAGKYCYTNHPDWKLQAQGNLFLNLGVFTLNASMQYGDFELYETEISRKKDLWKYDISPSLKTSFFRNRVSLQLGMGYYYERFESSNLEYTGRLEGRMGNTVFFIEGNYTHLTDAYASLNNEKYYYKNISIGLTEKMPTVINRNTFRRYSVDINVFYDENNNNLQDADEKPAVGKIVYIGQEAFISDAKGRVHYSNLPKGELLIRFPSEHGWYSPDFTVLLNTSRNFTIALHQTGMIMGTISYLKDSLYSPYVMKIISGIAVEAKSPFGQIYRTITDESGNFVFYLPLGRYEISLVKGQFNPVDVEHTEQTYPLNVLDSKKIYNLHFRLGLKKRNVKVHLFGSNRNFSDYRMSSNF